MRMLFAAGLATLAIAAHPARADEAEQGRAIAERWCAECHVIAEDQPQGGDSAPAFPALAQDPARDDAWLRGWIANPHPPMPDPGLSRAQIDAVVAYLRTLEN